MPFRFTIMSLCATVLSACAPSDVADDTARAASSVEFEEPVSIVDGEQANGIHYNVVDAEQAESSVVTAYGLFFPILVAGWNDFSVNLDGDP